MGGLIAVLILSYFLSFSTIFLCFYALAVKLRIGKKQSDLFRLFGAGVLSILFTSSLVKIIMIHTLNSICVSLIVHVSLMTYLTTFSFDTLSKPRNIFLLVKQRIAPKMNPSAFGCLLSFLGIVTAFFIIAFLFIQD